MDDFPQLLANHDYDQYKAASAMLAADMTKLLDDDGRIRFGALLAEVDPLVLSQHFRIDERLRLSTDEEIRDLTDCFIAALKSSLPLMLLPAPLTPQ